MKKPAILLSVILLFIMAAFRVDKTSEDYIHIQPSVQRSGDSAKGYNYLVTGDFLRSGMPYGYFTLLRGKQTINLLNRNGKNATVDYGYNVVAGRDSVDIVIPTCLQCHAQVFDDQLIVGLGNNSMDFSNPPDPNKYLGALKMLKMTAPKQYDASKDFLRSMRIVTPLTITKVRGVNPADGLAAVLAAHRDPVTLAWSDSALLSLPPDIIPTDVPAWWLLKKKNAMFYTGLGRGDFARFLMLSNMLTVTDTMEARDVNNHFGDVLAYVLSLQPPKYPKPVNDKLAAKGKLIFNDHCSECHGTYGAGGSYPNLLIPGDVIQTDPTLFKANQQNPQFADWFKKSWFAQPPYAALIVPSEGYVAPPLDGVWVTAPYLHNGSVPTIEAVLNSKLRPTYWTRDFSHPTYDYEKLGWKYDTTDKSEGKKYYNTTLTGYGNYGHYFGDVLTDEERKAVIEYLKTL